jgi:hypothetical protein
MSFASHCRVWDGHHMHYLSSMLSDQSDYSLVFMEDALVLINKFNPKEKHLYQSKTHWKLMLSVGQMDRQENLLFDYDIVECEGHVWVIRTHIDRCGFSLFMPHSIGLTPSIPLDRDLAGMATLMGNYYEDPHLIVGVPESSHRQAA